MKTCLPRSPIRLIVLVMTVAVAGTALVAGGRSSVLAPQAAARQVVNDDKAVPGEVLVRFRAKVSGAALAAIASEVDADWHREVGGAGVRLLHSRRLKASELVSRLSHRPDVVYAEPNYIVRALDVPRDPSFPQLWGLQNLGQSANGGLPGTPGADIHAVEAWDVSTGTAGTVVAVVDTGIDYTHPDLAPNVWSAPASFTVTIGGRAITCGAGTHGFNAIAKTCDPMDDHDHGSHVSGTIGAAGNNGLGVVGVNWTASIMGLKFLGADGSGTTADAIDAMEFAIQAKAVFAANHAADIRVLSNSWGDTDFSQALLDEIVRVNDYDMLFVAAAGNSGLPNELFPTYPASYVAPNIIAVAATDNADRRAYFSNYGSTTVHLGAPGVDILSTTIGNTYSYFSGTSMAAPHVSGAAALILSKCALDTAGLKADILNSVDPVAGLAGMTITGGRLNVNNAIRGCSVPPSVPTGLVATPAPSKVTLAWSAVAGAATYNVKRSLTAGGPYTTVASPGVAAYIDQAVTNDTTYYYVVSAANGLGESADSGEVSATPTIPPDLLVSALDAPSSIAPGSTVLIGVGTKNQGPGNAAATVTRFYLSTDLGLHAGDTLLEGGRAVPPLLAGASSLGSASVTFPVNLGVGTYYLIAKADADGTVAEASETNNTAVRAFQSGPDLVVSAFTSPAIAAAGETIAVSETTKNQGTALAAASTTRFYLSARASFDGTAVLLGGTCAVPALTAGATSIGSTSVVLPTPLTPGSYYLFAKADADGVVPETYEGNNTALRSVQIGGDLVVSSLKVPASAASGSTIVVTDVTKNQGSAAIAESTTRYYLSTNFAFDAGDVLLGGGRAVPALAAGASSAGSASVTVPASLPAATYYVIAKADADGVVPETSETNNTAGAALAIGADLVVSSLLVPSGVAAGATVSITDSTSNRGGGPAAASVTRFYLSTTYSIDGAAIALDGSRTVPPLAAGASSSGSTSVVLPADLAVGTYYLIAKADADGTVAEATETNNTMTRIVQSGADLVVSSIVTPASSVSGGTVIVTETTKNQGSSVASASTTRFYLSTNTTFDSSDILLGGSRAVSSLAPGASSTGATSVTIPAGLPAGTYYVFAVADADGVVGETYEGNNTNLRGIAVTSPATVESSGAGR